jgi:S-adenosylmethionine hydrolase
VDPGVGTARRAMIWHAKDGYSFIAPDNGVLSYIFPELEAESKQVALWEITESPLPSITSVTFHGRDIFAPAAALTAGEQLQTPAAQEILKQIERDTLVQFPTPRQQATDTGISGEILYIDHFGNIVTSIGHLTWQDAGGLAFNASFAHGLPQRTVPANAQITIGNTQLPRINRTYGEVEIGDLLALIGSSGYLEISVNGGNAAARLNANVGDTVTLHIPEGD